MMEVSSDVAIYLKLSYRCDVAPQKNGRLVKCELRQTIVAIVVRATRRPSIKSMRRVPRRGPAPLLEAAGVDKPGVDS